MYKILIVEDDATIAGVLSSHLAKWGFQVQTVEDFHTVLDQFLRFDPQLVILDVTLPCFNGYHWCGEIRKLSKVPILFLSSAADNMNILMAINLGADDYISKPFDLEIVLAKVQALLRRSYDFQGRTAILEHRGALLNLSDATLTFQEQKIDLTKNEFRILQVLMENKGAVVSRDVIMKRLWENDSFVDDNTLTVNVTRLRRKLEEAGLPDFIVTKKGIGYLVKA